LLCAVLFLVGCSSEPPPAVVSNEPLALGSALGIDLPTDARDVSMELKGSHLDFIARYYRDPTSRWPPLSAAEAQAVSSVGLRLVALWESRAQNPSYFSYASGYADAQSAYRQARAIGQPPGSAIYFAVDYNAPSRDVEGTIDHYFRGVLAGLITEAGGHQPEYRIGVYGSGSVCGYLKGARLVQLTWLSNSTAWEGYGGFSDWDIRQGMKSRNLSFSHDSNEARGDYGGFLVGSKASAS
jgi:hypothetical protein